MIPKFQKFKFIFLFPCLFVFLFLISIQTAKAVPCTPDGCYCWCKCPDNTCWLHREWEGTLEPTSEGQDKCNKYCFDAKGTAINYDATTGSSPAECTGGGHGAESCEITSVTPPTPPTAPAEKPPTNIVTREAPTCIVTPECSARYLETKKGFLKGISEKCYCCGDCGLNDVVNLFIGAANYLFGIVGALALLFFIYGGVLLLTAAGKSEQIEKGKKVLIGAAIGLAIVFGAWLIVQFVMTALGVQSTFVNQFLKTR